MVDEDDVDEVHEGGGDGQVDFSKLESNVSYVIVNYEGSFFPGLVKEIVGTSIKVSCMTPIPSKMMKSLWKWPEKIDECFYEEKNVISIIETPVMVGNRGKYKVLEAEKYW